jgi:hypothetical protein
VTLGNHENYSCAAQVLVGAFLSTSILRIQVINGIVLILVDAFDVFTH